MPIDRPATLRQAEKLVRQGKLDQAIAEYRHLVEDQPGDWNTANLLGDLYVRAGQLDPAIEQFSRIAASLRHDGFLSKASALYTKVLKFKPDSDHALMQAGELAAEQGLLANARTCFTTAAAGRRQRGDMRGALEVVARLGRLDNADVEARLAGARAFLELGDTPGALGAFTDLGLMLVESGRDDEALVPLREVAAVDPGNAVVIRELVRILVAQGLTSEAAPFLTPEIIDQDPGLALLAVDQRLRHGDTESGLEMAGALLARDGSVMAGLLDLALTLAEGQPQVAYSVADLVVSASVARGDWSGAAEALKRFVSCAPAHVAALARLVDVCVDGGLQDDSCEAQGQLADAYLASGAAAEARYVAEDLVTRQPWAHGHFSRLRAALEAEGAPDADRALADWLAAAPSFGAGHDTFGERFPEPVPMPLAEPAHEPSANPHAIDLGLVFGRPAAAPLQQAAAHPLNVEEDLTVMLDETRVPAAAAPPPAPPEDLDEVFAHLRDEVVQRDGEADAAFIRGQVMFDAGEVEQAIEQLRTAARSPQRRFAAASLLARVYQQQERTADAIEWLGHAVDAPGLTHAERCAALLSLADLLERSGEPASALAVCLELQSDAGDYKDLAARIERLSRASGG